MAAKKLSTSRVAGIVATIVAISSVGVAAFGATSTFVVNATNWNDTNSWANGDLSTAPTTGGGTIPDGPGAVAIFQQLVSSNGGATITLGTGRTVGVLTVRDATGYSGTLAITNASSTLTFDNSGSPAQLNEIGDVAAADAGRLRITAKVQLNSNLNVNITHNLDKNTVTEIAGPISGAANIAITKTGPGSFQLGYVSSTDRAGHFLGNVDVQQGLLRIINPGTSPGNAENNFMLAQSSGVYIHDGAQMQLGNTLTAWSLGANAANPDGLAVLTLEGIGDTSNPTANLPEGALRFDQANANPLTCTVDSPIMLATTSRIYVDSANVTGVLTQEVRGTGTAGLNKGGSGLLKLTTTSANGNTYAGTTNVSKGALAVNNTVSTASGVGSGNVNVTDSGSGAILGGTGFIGTSSAPSNVTLTGAASAIGAALYPGNLNAANASPFVTSTPGILTIHGNLSFNALSSLNVDINGATAGTQYDQIAEHGTVTLGGAALNINLGSYTPTGAETFNLIDNFGAQSVSGVFGAINGMAGTYDEGAAITLGSATYHITYAGGANHNDVMLVGGAVPVGVPGDFNNNGVVDMADYVLWRNGGPLQNEISDIGTVTALDYDDWRAHFGNTSGSGSGLGSSSAVPEPTSALLALFGVAALIINSRKR
jgi:fibronectin-binding autotransporter adhesin